MNITRVAKITDEIVSAFERLVPQLASSSPSPNAEQLAEIVTSPATRLFVARDPDCNNEIVGALTLVLYRIPTGVCARIEDVVVDEKTRGKGIGKALTLAAMRYAGEAGADAIDLTSRPSRVAANQLYRDLGFVLRETNVYRRTLK